MRTSAQFTNASFSSAAPSVCNASDQRSARRSSTSLSQYSHSVRQLTSTCSSTEVRVSDYAAPVAHVSSSRLNSESAAFAGPPTHRRDRYVSALFSGTPSATLSTCSACCCCLDTIADASPLWHSARMFRCRVAIIVLSTLYCTGIVQRSCSEVESSRVESSRYVACSEDLERLPNVLTHTLVRFMTYGPLMSRAPYSQTSVLNSTFVIVRVRLRYD